MRPFKASLAAVALTICFTTAMPCVAEQPPDSPGVIPADRFLDNLVGDWDITRKIRGETVGNQARATWILNHKFVQLNMVDVASPPEYAALVLIGYDESTREYVAHWCDSFGAQYSAVGRGKLANDSVAFTFPYPDGPFINTFTWSPTEGTWTSYMENVEPDGTRRFFAEDTYRRHRGAVAKPRP